MRNRAIRGGPIASILWGCRFRQPQACWPQHPSLLRHSGASLVDFHSVACLVGLSGFLMVSTWRFWSGKEINLSRRHPFQLLFVISIVLYVALRYSNVVLFAVALVYMFSGIWARAAYSWSRRRRRKPTETPTPEAAATEPDPFRPL